MNNPPTQALATTAPAAGSVISAERDEVRFKGFGTDDEIKLSVAVIRDLIAVPAKVDNGDPIYPERRDSIRFMMLCRAQRLNPFAGDAYMIGYKNRNTGEVNWSLITAHTAFLKRAELHPDYDGLESGVIVMHDEVIEYLQGDFVPPDCTLLGGWATTFFKKRSKPMMKRLKLETYQKRFGVWLTDGAGMIVKCAEVHSLRDSFPTMLGGMMLREEYLDIESEVVAPKQLKRPEFATGLPAQNLSATKPEPVKAKSAAEQAKAQTQQRQQAKPAPKPAATPQPAATPPLEVLPPAQQQQEQQTEPQDAGEAQPGDQGGELAPEQAEEPNPEPFEPNPDESPALQSVRLAMHGANIPESQLMIWAQNNAFAKPEQKQISDMANSKLEKIAANWNMIVNDVRTAVKKSG